MLNISRSSYYYKPRSLNKQIQDADVLDRIDQILCDLPGYGTRRVTAQLKKDGFKINRKRIQRLMREHSLLRVVKRRWISTTQSDHPFNRYPNVAKDVIVTTINQLWVADITYIRILTGFIYLAVIMDIYSRKIVGYALSRTLEDDLTLAALHMAIELRHPPEGCVHHSDQGTQYASNDYVDLLKEHKFTISMSAKGNPYENAFAESFYKTLKYEEVYLWDYQTVDDVKQRIPFFIQRVYNQKRLHSALDYCSPNEFESNLFNQSAPCLTVT
jgi:transposase InsO family protein